MANEFVVLAKQDNQARGIGQFALDFMSGTLGNPAAVDASHLAGHHAVLFTPSSGAFSDKTFLVVDANGVAGYQAGADLVILLGGNSVNFETLTDLNFV